MKKLNKFFITALVAGLVAFSAALAIPTQMAQALIGTSQIENNAITSPKIKDGEVKTNDLATAAVTKEKLNPNAVKLVVIPRFSDDEPIPPQSVVTVIAECNSDEVVTGGGFTAGSGLQVFINSGSQSQNGWQVSSVNPTDDDKDVRATVKCAHLELGP